MILFFLFCAANFVGTNAYAVGRHSHDSQKKYSVNTFNNSIIYANMANQSPMAKLSGMKPAK